MYKVELTTHLFPFVSINFYEDLASPEFFFEADYAEMPEYMEETGFEFDGYKRAFIPLVQARADRVQKSLEHLGVFRIEVKDIKSPREYNFMSDWADIDVFLEDGARQKLLDVVDRAKNDMACKDVAKEYFSSRSGFVSFFPGTDWKELKEGIDEMEERAIGEVLTLALILVEGYFYPEDEWGMIVRDALDHGGIGCLEDYATFGYTIPESCTDLYDSGLEYKKDEFYWKAMDKFGYKWKGKEKNDRGDHLLSLMEWMKENGKEYGDVMYDGE